ncbi:MAG: hypothetical protein WD942_08315 [Dehalococcoidia bacterium]
MSIVVEIEARLHAGEPITAEALGGTQAILAEADELVGAPYADVLVLLADAADSRDAPILDDLVRRSISAGSQPLVLRQAITLVVDSDRLRSRIGHSLQRILEQRVEERAEGTSALTAAYSLEGLFRLALVGVISRHRLLGLMTDLRDPEVSLFSEHAAKLIGAAFHVWREPDLLDALDRLRMNSDAEAEAAFELGLGYLSCSMTSTQPAEIAELLETARTLMAQACEAGENRADAVAYGAVIDLIQAFSAGAQRDSMPRLLSDLMAAIADRANLLAASELPEWLRPRVDREAQWVRLLRMATRLAEDLERPSWLNASAVMGQLLLVYDADRSLQVGVGLEHLIRPRIEGGLARQRGLLAHLDDLLQDEHWTKEHGEAAGRLRAQISKLAQEEVVAPGKAPEDDLYPVLRSVLQDESIVATIPTEMAGRLEEALADRTWRDENIANPVVQRILKQAREAFSAAAHYRDVVASDFDDLILQVVLFCKDRQDAVRKELGKRGAYLHSPDVTEFDLQADLREWLSGNYPRADVRTEVEGVAAGRADIYVGLGGHRFIIELKRHKGIITPESARQYRSQSASYQATNVRLGMLGILELVERTGPAPSLEESVWFESFVPQGGRLSRHLLVFRVPGNRALPSSMAGIA